MAGPAAASRQSGVPFQLGDFRILNEIGRGGMGVVYEADQVSLGRRVAVKVLPFAALLDRRQLERFRNEARAAAMLKHANIVSVLSVGYEAGVHFYAMELIEGCSVAEVISQSYSRTDQTDDHSDNHLTASQPVSSTPKTHVETNSLGLRSTEISRDRRSFTGSPCSSRVQA